MANRDQNSNVGFTNTNVYYLYKKAKAASEIAKAIPQTSNKIIRPSELDDSHTDIKIESYAPKALKKENIAPTSFSAEESLANLKNNLNSLKELHQRLNIMLREIEVMVAKKK